MATRQTYDWGGGTLTAEQVAQIAYQAGFRGDSLIGITAIGERESGYRPGIHGSDQPQSSVSGDRGLFQINSTHDDNLIQAGIINSPEDLFDPVINARAAYYLSNEGSAEGIQELWQAGPGGWQEGGDPYYGTDRAAAAAAVQAAGSQGLLGQDWGGDDLANPPPRAGYYTPDEQPLTPEQREAQETARKLGNMGHPGWREHATAKPKVLTARRAAIERILGEKEEKDPEKWAAAAKRLGNKGFQRFAPFSTLGEDELNEAQLERTAQQLGNLGLKRWDEAATAPERVQTRRRRALFELVGKGQRPKEYLAAAQKLGNKGMVRFQGYSTVPEAKLERRQERYQNRQAAEKADEIARQEMTDLLRGYGIKYENAPTPTPALLAYLRGVGLNFDQAKRLKDTSIRRTRSMAREQMSDITRMSGRTARATTADLASRGVLGSGQANTRYAENAVDTEEAREDVARARLQGVQNARLGYGTTATGLRVGALERVAQEQESQDVAEATRRATARAYRRQTRQTRRSNRRIKNANEAALQRLEDLYANYANQGISV
jgi:hypothetical protein